MAMSNYPGNVRVFDATTLAKSTEQSIAANTETAIAGDNPSRSAEFSGDYRTETVTSPESLQSLISNLKPGEVLIYKAAPESEPSVSEDYFSILKARINEISSNLEALKNELIQQVNS